MVYETKWLGDCWALTTNDGCFFASFFHLFPNNDLMALHFLFLLNSGRLYVTGIRWWTTRCLARYHLTISWTVPCLRVSVHVVAMEQARPTVLMPVMNEI